MASKVVHQYCWECGQVVAFYWAHDDGVYEVYYDNEGHEWRVAVR